MTELSPPKFARVRYAARADYDTDAAHAVLDQGLVAHVGFVVDGRPFVIPMAYARGEHCLYLHGASKTRIVRANDDGVPMCLTVTLTDGLVVARSGFHHSANYRCVVVHGRARAVRDAAEHAHALDLILDHLLPGRSAEVRAMNAQERKATGVLALEVEAMSVKRRGGGPIDDAEDHSLPIWAGVVPVVTALGRALPDAFTDAGTPEPPSIAAARRRFA